MSVDSLTKVTVSPTGTFHIMAPEGVATLCGIDLSYPRRTWWPVWRSNFDRFTYRCAKCEREARRVGVCKCGHEEWQHVWNSVALPSGQPPFSEAACAVTGCECEDFDGVSHLARLTNAEK